MANNSKKNLVEMMLLDNGTSTKKPAETETDKGGGDGLVFNPVKDSDEVVKAREVADQYASFKQSDDATNAYNAWNNHNSTKPTDWTRGASWDAYQQAMDKINNREAFSYDINADALYQQYKDQYLTQGNLAMKDTLGKATALTGGYGNSYAVTAGNQAYQGYVDKLNSVVPELYQLAYDKYNNETNELYNQLNLAKNVYDTEYGEYRDKLSDWYTEDNRLVDNYLNLYDRDRTDYDKARTYYNTDRSFNEGVRQYNTTLAEDQRQYDKSLLEEQRQYNTDLEYQMEKDKAEAAAAALALKQKEKEEYENSYVGQLDASIKEHPDNLAHYQAVVIKAYRKKEISDEEYSQCMKLLDDAYQEWTKKTGQR